MPGTGHSVGVSAEVEYRLSLMAGGGDRVLRGDGDEGAVTAQSPLSLRVDAGTFRGYIADRMVRLAVSTQTDAIAVPNTVGSPGDETRIDLVQYSLAGGLNIKAGTEDASPAAPSADADSLVLAEIHCRNGMASVKDTDDASNGYIVQNTARFTGV